MSLFRRMHLPTVGEVAYLRPAAPRLGMVPLHGRGATGPRFAGRCFGDLASRPIPGLAVIWPTGTGTDGQEGRVWGIPTAGQPGDLPRVRACVLELRSWGCERVIVPGESAGAAMAWWLAAYKPTTADAYAPCNLPIPEWAKSQPYQGAPVWHELGRQDRTVFGASEEVDAAAAAARAWLGALFAGGSANGITTWTDRLGRAQVHVGSRWGHAWRDGDAWATHRKLVEWARTVWATE